MNKKQSEIKIRQAVTQVDQMLGMAFPNGNDNEGY